MAKKIPIDRLSAEINKILTEYGEEVQQNVDEAAAKVTKAGVRAIRSNASGTFGGSGKYAKGWTSKFEKGRMSSQGIIYNGAVPGLPHLLEHGHANRNGGRTAGRPHIAPVEQKLIEDFEKKVKAAI